jgi:hypothetical protein
MAALNTSIVLLLLAASFHQAAALSVASVHTSTFFDPARNWMGETTLHELFDDDTVDQLQQAGLIKTRQNPDLPDRTQYFVVETPADADLIYAECPKEANGENAKEQKQKEANAQNFKKEWINSEKLLEEYGDDKIENLVQSGRLDKRQHPDFPEQTQFGKEWISTQSLLEKYGFDKVEELLKGGRVDKRQNPRCPERTQYFVKEEPSNSAQAEEEEEEVQEPEEAKVKRHETKTQKHGKAKNRDVSLHKHGDKKPKAQVQDKAITQKQDEPKVQKHGKEHNSKGNLQKHDDEEVIVQKHEEDIEKHVNKKDADGVVDSDGEEKSAAMPSRVLATVVVIATSAFFV